MAKRPLIVRSVFTGFAAAGLFAGGCQNATSQSQNKSRPDSVLAQVGEESEPLEKAPAPPVVAPPPGADEAVALTNRVKQYTQQMAPLLENRPKPAEPATQPVTGERSDVQWIKPGTPVTALPKAPVPVTVIPMVQPVVDAQPSTANQQLSIAAGATGAQAGLATNPDSTMRISPDDLNRTVSTPRAPVLGADMDAKFTRHIQEYPRDLWAHLDFQLLRFLRDEQVPQLDALTSLPLEDRELMAAVMDGLTNFRNTLRADNNMLLSKKIKPLLELTDRLRSQAELNIPTLSLCTRVDGFGAYEPIEPLRFIAGKEHQAIIYCEVENFASTPSSPSTSSVMAASTDRKSAEHERKTWETRLSQEAVLYTESGMQVWVDKAGTVVDHSRNRRRDFFIVKKIKLPAALTIGRYLLKVTVEDQQAKRVAEQTMQIEIVAQVEGDMPLAGNKN